MSVHYPVFLDLEGRWCLVVGGGTVAAGKARGLLEAGARVLVVSPTLHQILSALAAAAAVIHRAREFRDDDLEGCVLAIAATGRPEVNRAVCSAARARRILVNAVDRPEECDFYAPAVLRRGPLQIAISTEGKSPLLARAIREELEARFGPEYARYVELLAEIRAEWLRRHEAVASRRVMFQRVMTADLLGAVRAGDQARIAEIVAGAVGLGEPVAAAS
jgi:precorrin-2 dehydrogenase/sirohydrochlorin ferrochelatase